MTSKANKSKIQIVKVPVAVTLTEADQFNMISHGDRVTIVDRFGKNHTGRATLLGPAGWVLNMGGRYGTPAIANENNIVKVVYAK